MIRDLVELISKLTDFKGEIRWQASKPDGQPRRRLDLPRRVYRLFDGFSGDEAPSFVGGVLRGAELRTQGKVGHGERG